MADSVRLASDKILADCDGRTLKDVLHDVSAEGGLGFCHAGLPNILPFGYHGPLVLAVDSNHGPLVLAVDSNVLIDFQKHGNELLDGDVRAEEEKYAEELTSLGTLLNLWMLRDIRFVATPRSRTDAKRKMPGFDSVIEGLAEAVAFQYGDWTFPAPSHGPDLLPVGDEHGLPDGADRDLVLEAQTAGAHVFLTRDGRVLRRAALTGPAMRVWAPSELADELVLSGVGLIGGGLCGEPECPYTESMIPAPDMGKWGPLFACFQDD
ncbi:hypothetical protein BN11_190003 [Nostocoides australiense Ben110]|uniref:PIN domain-containing protein n=1 Tax=Nostocoides australiense Ben110 TaxID=1193182 RepID=W6JTP0_9MICO|nr:hypothetical protein [Tetrasphaera australiensis]CCH72693.1 hypothetical protein BN11_190003 [Tetrasphaera australiensis Ben110]